MDNWYPEQPPRFVEAGEFEAVIYASDRPETSGAQGHSYAAFALRRKGAAAYGVGAVGSRGDSEEYRGYAAAAVGVVESLPHDSKVVIRSHHKTIVSVFNDWMPGWKKNGWKRKNKQPIAALEILQRFDAIVAERNIDMEPFECVAKDDPQFKAVFDILAQKIDSTAKRDKP